MPGAHYISQELIEKFYKGVEAESGGEISFEYYPAGQVGKDVPALLQSGVIDIGQVIIGAYSEKFPLSGVVELPQVDSSACIATERFWAVAQPGGALDVLEYQPAGLRALGAHVLTPLLLFTGAGTIEKPEDVKGLKVHASSRPLELAIQSLDGVPVRIQGPEVYEAVTRGTIDASVFSYTGMKQYDLVPHLSSSVDNVGFGSAAFMISMSEASWSRLSADQQELITRHMGEAQSHFCEWLDTHEASIRDEIAARPNFTVSVIEGEHKDAFSDTLGELAANWAAQMDAAGQKGSEILKAFNEAASQ